MTDDTGARHRHRTTSFSQHRLSLENIVWLTVAIYCDCKDIQLRQVSFYDLLSVTQLSRLSTFVFDVSVSAAYLLGSDQHIKHVTLPSYNDCFRNDRLCDDGKLGAAVIIRRLIHILPFVRDGACLCWPAAASVALVFDRLPPSVMLLACFSFCWKGCSSSLILWVALLSCWRYCPAKVWTQGEWILVTAALAYGTSYSLSVENFMDVALVVATCGIWGSVFAAAIVAKFAVGWTVRQKAGLLLFIPFTIMESYFFVVQKRLEFFQSPKWLLRWLMETEKSNTVDSSSAIRWKWVLYWICVLALGLPVIPSHHRRVLTRKYFHLLATILFVPVTIVAPVLQSFAYAVGLGVLILLECGIRRDVPFLSALYSQHMDFAKDSTYIISHLFLILGCALPLWLSQILHLRDNRLAIWGVASAAIGDALAAVVGVLLGRHKHFGESNMRTFEGSLAMLVGTLCIMEMFPPTNRVCLVVCCLATTIVEAYTKQIDNLFLPLIGAMILL